MTTLGRLILVVFTLLITLKLSHAGVSGFRTDNGEYLDAQLPESWSAEQNVIWKTSLPDWSNATPVISGERIFVQAEPTTLLAINKTNGKILWKAGNSYNDIVPAADKAKAEKLMAESSELLAKYRSAKKQVEEIEKLKRWKRMLEMGGDKYEQRVKRMERDNPGLLENESDHRAAYEKIKREAMPAIQFQVPRTHDNNGYSSATPVSDGTNVYALFTNGVACAYTHEGKRVWARVVDRPDHVWGDSASPVLAGGKLIVMLNTKAYALDPKTGETLWTTEVMHSWGSPIVIKVGGEDVILCPDGQWLAAADGKRVAAAHFIEYNTPTVDGEWVYYIDAGKAAAYKIPQSIPQDGQLEKLWETLPATDWKIRGDNRYYASPVVQGGKIFIVARNGIYTVVDARTGKLNYREELKDGKNANEFYPSLVLAGDRIILTSQSGNMRIIDPETFKITNTFPVEYARTTPIIDGNVLYWRGKDHLYAIGKK